MPYGGPIFCFCDTSPLHMYDQWFYLWCYFLAVWQRIAGEKVIFIIIAIIIIIIMFNVYYFLAVWRQIADENIISIIIINDNVDKPFVKELQTIPYILKMYILKISHFTLVLSGSLVG